MDEIDLDLPPVEERLAALRPSRQLLEFYRRKTDELEAEHDKVGDQENDDDKVEIEELWQIPSKAAGDGTNPDVE